MAEDKLHSPTVAEMFSDVPQIALNRALNVLEAPDRANETLPAVEETASSPQKTASSPKNTTTPVKQTPLSPNKAPALRLSSSEDGYSEDTTDRSDYRLEDLMQPLTLSHQSFPPGTCSTDERGGIVSNSRSSSKKRNANKIASEPAPSRLINHKLTGPHFIQNLSELRKLSESKKLSELADSNAQNDDDELSPFETPPPDQAKRYESNLMMMRELAAAARVEENMMKSLSSGERSAGSLAEKAAARYHRWAKSQDPSYAELVTADHAAYRRASPPTLQMPLKKNTEPGFLRNNVPQRWLAAGPSTNESGERAQVSPPAKPVGSNIIGNNLAGITNNVSPYAAVLARSNTPVIGPTQHQGYNSQTTLPPVQVRYPQPFHHTTMSNHSGNGHSSSSDVTPVTTRSGSGSYSNPPVYNPRRFVEAGPGPPAEMRPEIPFDLPVSYPFSTSTSYSNSPSPYYSSSSYYASPFDNTRSQVTLEMLKGLDAGWTECHTPDLASPAMERTEPLYPSSPTDLGSPITPTDASFGYDYGDGYDDWTENKLVESPSQESTTTITNGRKRGGKMLMSAAKRIFRSARNRGQSDASISSQH